MAVIPFRRRAVSRSTTDDLGRGTWISQRPPTTSIAGKMQQLAFLSPSRLRVLEKTVDAWLAELDVNSKQR